MLGKLLKWVLIIIVVLIAFALVLLWVFDPNKYKSQIEAQVGQATGRQLTIAGDIGWQLFPTFGVSVDQVSLSNAEGFSESAMLELNHLAVAIQVLPLFRKQLALGDVVVDGVIFRYQQNGALNNLSDLTPDTPVPSVPETESTAPVAQTSVNLSELRIEGIRFSNILLESTDLVAGQTRSVQLDEFSLSSIELGQPALMKLSMSIADPTLQLKLASSGSLTLDDSLQSATIKQLTTQLSAKGDALPREFESQLELSMVWNGQQRSLVVDELKLGLDQMQLTGLASINYAQAIPKIRFDLSIDQFNLDTFLPPSNTASEQTSPSQAPEQPAQEPDLSVLNTLDVDGKVALGTLIASGLTISDIQLPVKIQQGHLLSAPVKAQLYGGSAQAIASLTAGRLNKYAFDAKIDEVQALPLLTDLLGKQLLAGTASATVKMKGEGLTPTVIKSNAIGKGQISFKDGAVLGINIPLMLREGKAKLKGESAIEQKTDFSSLTGSFTLANGVAHNPDLLMQSPLLRIAGAGDANLVDERLDYDLAIKLVGSLEGQGGKGLSKLAGATIPLAIKGPFAAPDIGIDFAKAAESKAKQELEQSINKELEKNKDAKKLKDALKGFGF